MKSKTLYDLDVALTSKIYKYKTVDDYYRDSCSIDYINDIKVPILVLNAYDDPFVCPTVLKNTNPNIIMGITETGGHLGFSEGILPWNIRNWTIDVSIEYLDSTRKLEK